MTALSTAYVAYVCGRSLAGISGSIPAGVMEVSYEWCVLSGRDLWDGPVLRPKESYPVCECVSECDKAPQ